MKSRPCTTGPWKVPPLTVLVTSPPTWIWLACGPVLHAPEPGLDQFGELGEVARVVSATGAVIAMFNPVGYRRTRLRAAFPLQGGLTACRRSIGGGYSRNNEGGIVAFRESGGRASARRLLARAGMLTGVVLMLSGTAAPAALASTAGITLSGNEFLLNGQPFVPRGFNSIALLNSPWCSTSNTAAAANNFTPTELSTARSSWNANTLRFQVSQLILAGPDGAAYAQQIQGGVGMALAAGFVVILSMQDQSPGCGPAEPLPSQETEDAWATLISNTTLGSNPYVMFELFNEPQNAPVTSATTNPKQETWPDWLSGGRQIGPSSTQTWAPYTPVGHQELVDYLRSTLNVTNVLIADGASFAESLTGIPILSDPGSSYQIAYAFHPYNYTGGQGDWDARWGYLAGSYALVATEWDY